MRRIRLLFCITVLKLLAAVCNPVFARNVVTKQYTVWTPDSWRIYEGSRFSSFDGVPANCKYFRDSKKKRQDMALSLCVLSISPEEVLRRVGFQRVEDNIVRVGSMDSQSAFIEERSGHLMVSAAASCGVSDGAGFHSALGNCYSAAIFGRDISIALETDGTEPLAIVRKVANSVSLRTPGQIEFFRKKVENFGLDDR